MSLFIGVIHTSIIRNSDEEEGVVQYIFNILLFFKESGAEKKNPIYRYIGLESSHLPTVFA